MVEMVYIPSQGDLVTLNFTPQAGHEQAGKRPALVVSNDQFHKRTNLMIACPITTTNRGFPLHLPLKNDLKTKGFIMCEHVKSIDYTARVVQLKERIDRETLDKALQMIDLFF